MSVLKVVPVTFTMPQPGTVCLELKQAKAVTSVGLPSKLSLRVVPVIVTKEHVETPRVSVQFL